MAPQVTIRDDPDQTIAGFDDTPMDEALREFSTRCQSRNVDAIVTALTVGRQTGGELPKVLETTAGVLREMAGYVTLSRYRKSPRGAKKKPPKRSRYKNGAHVSTARLLAEQGSKR